MRKIPLLSIVITSAFVVGAAPLLAQSADSAKAPATGVVVKSTTTGPRGGVANTTGTVARTDTGVTRTTATTNAAGRTVRTATANTAAGNGAVTRTKAVTSPAGNARTRTTRVSRP